MHSLKEQSAIKGKITVKRHKAGKTEVVFEQANLVVSNSNRGRNLLCQWLAGIGTYAIGITHGEIGTGSTAPANSDTSLQTGTNRVAVTAYVINNNVITLQFFFSNAALPNGTYNEFGTFIAGSATLGTGQLFNRAIFSSPYVKASGEDTTVEVEFTIT